MPKRPIAASGPAVAEKPAYQAEAPAPNQAAMSSAQVNAAAKRSNAFALALLRGIERNDQSVIIAPASVVMALHMLAAGARGETAQELASLLHIESGDLEGLSQALSEAERRAALDGHTLTFANAFYAHKTLPVRAAFRAQLGTVYGATFESVDFAAAPEAGRERINAWVEEKTLGRVRDVLMEGSIDALTRGVIVNAMYMLAKWQTPFDPNQTQPGSFETLSEGKVDDVPFMRRTGDVAVATGEHATLIELPYAGAHLALDVVLPETAHGLTRLRERLDEGQLATLVAALSPQRASLRMPRFKFELPAVALKGQLASLGAKQAFDPQRADLSGIAGEPHDLFASDVYHGAFIEVNEQGTEAAGATAAVIQLRGMPAKPVVIDIDHPFLFFVRDMVNGAILFAGQVVDPLST